MIHPLDVRIGNYKLIHSLSVLPIENHNIHIKLDDGTSGLYKITIQFLDDIRVHSNQIETTAISRDHLLVRFYNFTAEQSGTTAPLNIGTLKGVSLFLHIRLLNLTQSGNLAIINFLTNAN